MADTSEISFQVRQTTIDVCYKDITKLEADAFVSSDDVHMSGTSGLSAAIREAAGVRLRYDIRKFALPKPLGSVVVTGGGKLPVKYILHTLTTSFDEQPRFELLVPQLINQVLYICNALEVQTLAMPMINAGLIKVPPATILQVIAQGAACYLASNSSSVRRIILAVYNDDMKDQKVAETRLMDSLNEVRAIIKGWDEAARPINQRLGLLAPLGDGAPEDLELQELVKKRIEEADHKLRELFVCPNPMQATLLLGAQPRQGGAPTTLAQYKKAKGRLETLLENLQREINHLLKIQQINRGRLEALEVKAALKGIDAPADVVIEMEDLKTAIEGATRDITQLQAQLEDADRQLQSLKRHWEPT